MLTGFSYCNDQLHVRNSSLTKCEPFSLVGKNTENAVKISNKDITGADDVHENVEHNSDK